MLRCGHLDSLQLYSLAPVVQCPHCISSIITNYDSFITVVDLYKTGGHVRKLDNPIVDAFSGLSDK